MAEAPDALFARLESSLQEWSSELTATYSRLSERLASARERMGVAPEAQGALEHVAAELRAQQTQFDSLHTGVRQCLEAVRKALERVAELDRAFSMMEDDMRGLKFASATAVADPFVDDQPEPYDPEPVAELRALLDEQRERIERIEQSQLGLPTAQQFSRIERDLARLRSELHRLRGAPRETGEAPATAFGDTFDEVASPDTVDLDLTGFDNAGRRRRMGEILVQAGVLTPLQLERALNIQQEQPQRRLGAILIELGYAESDVIAQVLAAQARVPFVRLDEDEPDPHAVRLVSERLAMHHVCIPVRTDDDGRLILAMANPMDLIAIEDVEHATGRSVDPVAASADGIQQAIKAYYGVDPR